MFIEGLDSNLYISDPSKLKVGMELWSVGQGGVSSVSKPYFQGIVVALNKKTDCKGGIEDRDNWILFKRPDSPHLSDTSMLDHHVVPQTYNNWYYCSSKNDADMVYQFMNGAWNNNSAFEQSRKEADRQSAWMDYDWDYFDPRDVD